MKRLLALFALSSSGKYFKRNLLTMMGGESYTDVRFRVIKVIDDYIMRCIGIIYYFSR